MPLALKSRVVEGDEFAQALPPYARRPAFLVDKYPACPKDWMRSTGNVSSYFVPIKSDHGMWLDFNRIETPYHLAVVVSVQGVNAITGLPCEDANLQQYVENCPKCKEAFGHERFCKKCGYKWPKQNYIATTAQPLGQMWIDGFRAVDGAVRQYILTAEKARGVAAYIIGQKRVFAVGMSFFLSKEQRPEPPKVIREDHYHKSVFFEHYDPPVEYMKFDKDSSGSLPPDGTWITCSDCSSNGSSGNTHTFTAHHKFNLISTADCMDASGVSVRSIGVGKSASASRQMVNSTRSAQPVSVTKLEVGAGAKIDQKIHDDPYDLTFWNDHPAGVILVNYVLEDECRKILSAGEEDVEGHGDGFLKDVPVGN